MKTTTALAILSLAFSCVSAASDYIHGSIVLVDGGWMGR